MHRRPNLEGISDEIHINGGGSGAVPAGHGPSADSQRIGLLVGGYPLTEDGLGKPAPETARLPGFEGAKPADRRRSIALGTLQASKPYHFAPLTVILGGAAAGKPIHSLADLDGMTIGVEGGTLSDAILMVHGNGRLIDHITHFLPGRGQIWPGLEHGDFDATLAPLHRFDAWRSGHADTKLRASGYFHSVGFNLGFAGLARDAALLASPAMRLCWRRSMPRWR